MLPITIKDVARNNRLKVTIKGTQYWLAPHQVRTSKPRNVVVQCRQFAEDYASTRAAAECKKKKK